MEMWINLLCQHYSVRPILGIIVHSSNVQCILKTEKEEVKETPK